MFYFNGRELGQYLRTPDSWASFIYWSSPRPRKMRLEHDLVLIQKPSISGWAETNLETPNDSSRRRLRGRMSKDQGHGNRASRGGQTKQIKIQSKAWVKRRSGYPSRLLLGLRTGWHQNYCD